MASVVVGCLMIARVLGICYCGEIIVGGTMGLYLGFLSRKSRLIALGFPGGALWALGVGMLVDALVLGPLVVWCLLFLGAGTFSAVHSDESSVLRRLLRVSGAPAAAFLAPLALAAIIDVFLVVYYPGPLWFQFIFDFVAFSAGFLPVLMYHKLTAGSVRADS